MAPQKQNRIWTLNDVTNQRTSSDENANSSSRGVTGNDSDNDNGTIRNHNDPLSAPYCQPAAAAASSTPTTTIPLHHIPNLPMANVCESTLQRILREFDPIIQKRGYKVLSISELCCCGDGLDHAAAAAQPPRRGRKKKAALRKQPNNVWGYNQTRFLRGRGTTSHTIHLRLRNPTLPKHTRLLDWQDVAGTMAHELSHCVHQNHSKAFYALMEELLDEHATNQVNAMGDGIYGHAFGPNTSSTNSTSSTITPSSGGHKLGGNANHTKSRLVEEAVGGGTGTKLGVGVVVRDPQARRDAMAKAAEARRRQMEQIKRTIERSKEEPCVIELLSDDDDDDDDDEEEGDEKVQNAIHVHPARTTTRKQPPLATTTSRTSATTNHKDHQKPRAKQKRGSGGGNHPNDMGKPAPGPKPPLAAAAAAAKKPKVETIDLTEDSSAFPAKQDYPVANETRGEWMCGRCTFGNKPLALVCDMCLLERTT
jgi:hypothetical protein